MNVDELVTVVLLVTVGAVTTAAFYFGFAGLLGAFLFVFTKRIERGIAAAEEASSPAS